MCNVVARRGTTPKSPPITPTATRDEAGLRDSELALYELVARRYVQQFLPAFEFLRTKVELRIAGETFIARGRQVLALGWKAFAMEEPEREDATDEETEEGVLPPLTPGQKPTESARRRRAPPPSKPCSSAGSSSTGFSALSPPQLGELVTRGKAQGPCATVASSSPGCTCTSSGAPSTRRGVTWSFLSSSAAALANAALAPTPVSKSESSAQRSAVW